MTFKFGFRHLFYQAIASVALLGGLVSGSAAAPVWQETNLLQSALDNNYTYSSDATSKTGVVSFSNQVATNNDSASRHMGMYLAWAWSYDGSGAATSLLWDNASNRFVGGGVSLEVVGANGHVLLSDVVDDTWIGVGWNPGFGENPIATVGSWDVPLFDFGTIAAGASVSYDIELRFTFADDAAFADWDRRGSIYLGGQGVQAVPEPSSLAFVGIALVGVAACRRRQRKSPTAARPLH